MLRILLIWVILAFALGIAFGRFAREGMGAENSENQKQEATEADEEEDTDS